jgi:hypothetical protein
VQVRQQPTTHGPTGRKAELMLHLKQALPELAREPVDRRWLGHDLTQQLVGRDGAEHPV